MNVNMYMMKHELASIGITGQVDEDPLKRPYSCALPYDFSTDNNRRNAIFVCTAASLPPKPPASAPHALVCCGKPPAKWLEAVSSILYVPESIAFHRLFEATSDVFTKYSTWELELCEALAEDAPIERYGVLSRKIISSPFFVTNEGFKVLLHETATLKQKSRKAHEEYCLGMNGTKQPIQNDTYPSVDMVQHLVANPATRQAFAVEEPYLYEDPDYPYRSLTYNLGPEHDRMGTLCIDGVLREVGPIDYALAQVLGDYLERALRKKTRGAVAKTEEFVEVLSALLSHRLISEQRIRAVLDRIGYDMHDDFACLVVAVQPGRASSRVFESLAPAIAHQIPTDCYYVHDGLAVFIADLPLAGTDLDGLCMRVAPMLEESFLEGGLSRIYNDFKDLYYYYRQAVYAQRSSSRKETFSSSFCFYEDCCLDDMLEHVHAGAPMQTLLPEGLRRLVAYDAAHASELVPLLRVLLDCNFSIAETCRKAYLARNTCLYRLKRIREVSGIDLTLPDERLKLAIALRAIEADSRCS